MGTETLALATVAATTALGVFLLVFLIVTRPRVRLRRRQKKARINLMGGVSRRNGRK